MPQRRKVQSAEQCQSLGCNLNKITRILKKRRKRTRRSKTIKHRKSEKKQGTNIKKAKNACIDDTRILAKI